MTLCLKLDGGCEGVTPPKDCPHLAGEDGHHHHHEHSRRIRGIGTLDVFSGAVTVVDQPLPTCPEVIFPLFPPNSPFQVRILDQWLIMTFTIGNILILVLTVIIWTAVIRRRRKGL